MYAALNVDEIWRPNKSQPNASDMYQIWKKSKPEFLNIYWKLKSRLSVKSCLFEGQRVQQGLYRLYFLFADRKDFSEYILTGLKSGLNTYR